MYNSIDSYHFSGLSLWTKRSQWLFWFPEQSWSAFLKFSHTILIYCYVPSVQVKMGT